MVEPGQIEQAKEPKSCKKKDVGEEEPGNAEQCGGDEESHPEEDGERLQSPLHLAQSCTMFRCYLGMETNHGLVNIGAVIF